MATDISADTAEDSACASAEHLGAVYRYVRALVGSAHDAEDLTQDVFRKAAQHWEQIRSGDVRAWLFSTARNEVLQHYRRRGAEKRSMNAFQALLRGSQAGEMPPDEAEVKRMHEAALKAIETLEPQEREALRMKFVRALPNSEIAAAMKITPNHLGVLLFRALKKVRHTLEASRND